MEAVESAMGLGILLQVKDKASSEFGKIRQEMIVTKSASEEFTKHFDMGLKKLGIGLGMVAIGLGILCSAFIAPISAASDFEYAMSEVNTLVGKNPALMAKLGDEVDAMSIKFGKSGEEIAKATYQLISAGVEAEKAGSVLDVTGKLAIGGITDMETAADGLTSIMNAYGVAANDAIKVSDAMFVAMKRGKTTIGELSSSIGQVAPIAANVGLSYDDTLASIAAATLSGQKTAEAVTGLKATLMALAAPTAEISKRATEMGISFGASEIKSKGLLGVLRDLMEKTGGNAEKMRMLLGSVEAVNFTMNLMKENGSIFASIMDDMSKRAGATDEAFGLVAETTKFQWKVILQTITVGVKRMGTILLPVLGIVLKPIALIAKGFANIPAPLLTVVVGIISFIGVLLIAKGLMLIYAGATTLLAMVEIPKLVLSFSAARAGVMAFSSTLARALVPFMGLMIAGYLLKKAWENDFAGIRRMVEIFQVAWEIAGMAAEDGTVKIKKSMLDAVGGIGNLSRVQEVARWFFRIRMAAEELGTGIESTFSWIGNKVEWFAGQLSGLGSTFKPLQGIIDSLTGVGKTNAQQWKDWGLALGMVIGWIAMAIPIFYGIKAIMLAWKAVTLVVAAAQWVLNSALLANPITWIVIAVIAILALLYIYWDDIVLAFQTGWQWIKDMWTQFHDYILLAMIPFAPFIALIGYVITNWDYLSEAAQGCWASIVSSCISGYNWVTSTFNGIVTWFSELGTTFYTSGAALWDAFTNGIKSAVSGPIDAVKAGLQRIRNMLPFSDAKVGPLSTLTLSGQRLMTTIAEGVQIGSPQLVGAVAGGFGGIPFVGGNNSESETMSTEAGFGKMTPTLTERFVSSREVVNKTENMEKDSDSKPIEVVVYLDGEQVHRSVKKHDRYDELRKGKDDA